MPDIKKPIFVGGGNGSPVGTQDEVEHGKELAQRYRCEFVDLKNFHIQHELFRKIPVDLMFRYNFVPLEDKPDGRLVIAIADPSQLMMIDEIGSSVRLICSRSSFWTIRIALASVAR